MASTQSQITLGTFHSNTQMISEVSSILQKGRISYGPYSAEFEQDFANFCDCYYGVISNSGTSSLVVAIQALAELHKWQPEAEIIAPALTFVASINSIISSGFQPTLVDVSKRNGYTIDPDLIEEAITDKTVAIMPVHLFGLPCDMGKIMDIAKKHGLAIIEDCCEAFGAKYLMDKTKFRRVGSFGDVGCFSTYVGHHIVTGVGGMATTNDKRLAQLMRSLVNHGINVDNLPVGERYDPGHLGREFIFDRIGHSFRVTEIDAAIGLSQLSGASGMIAKRLQNRNVLKHYLKNLDKIHIPSNDSGIDKLDSPMVVPIVTMDGTPSSEIMDFIRKEGIECRTMMPLTNQPCYDFDEGKYPVAKYVNEHGFYVGCHQNLTSSNMATISMWVDEFFAKKENYRIGYETIINQ